MNVEQPEVELLMRNMFQPALPAREIDSHKGIFGSIAIIGGDEGMVGAVLLAARAALLVGAGRVYASVFAKNSLAVDLNYPEIMMRPVLSLRHLNQLDCVVIGPGLGQSERAIAEVEYWLDKTVTLLLDADALNLIATHAFLFAKLKSRNGETVITPHAGEAARVLACSSDFIQKNRVNSAIRLATMLHVVCILKGAGTLCVNVDGSCAVNSTGNPALATGGTGDVLSGIVGSLIAQGLGVLKAARLGVYVHGAAADALVAKGLGPLGIRASDVALEARDVINRLNNIT